MTFPAMSFGLWEDVDLTVPFNGAKQFVHQTNLSDNPQDFTLWLGSVVVDRILQAASNPGVDNITLTPTDTTVEWQASHSYSLGARVQATGGGDGFIYKVTTAGTSDSTEPAWNAGGLGSTTTDNSVIWTKISAKHEITEITLALSEGDLDINTPGDPLDVGIAIDSGAPDAVAIWIRVTNAVTNADNDINSPELALYINEVIEQAVS